MYEKSLDERAFELLLFYRGLEPDDVCESCNGMGVRTYGTTSTWMHQAGGASIVSGVCDKCWGSGSKTKKGCDLRRFYSAINCARTALGKIVADCGRVCGECEICEHESCRSSHMSWEIAKQAIEDLSKYNSHER